MVDLDGHPPADSDVLDGAAATSTSTSTVIPSHVPADVVFAPYQELDDTIFFEEDEEDCIAHQGGYQHGQYCKCKFVYQQPV